MICAVSCEMDKVSNAQIFAKAFSFDFHVRNINESEIIIWQYNNIAEMNGSEIDTFVV